VFVARRLSLSSSLAAAAALFDFDTKETEQGCRGRSPASKPRPAEGGWRTFATTPTLLLRLLLSSSQPTSNKDDEEEYVATPTSWSSVRTEAIRSLW
jgi:hypothetical protein